MQCGRVVFHARAEERSYRVGNIVSTLTDILVIAGISVALAGGAAAIGGVVILAIRFYLDYRVPHPDLRMALSDISQVVRLWERPPAVEFEVMIRLENRGAAKADVKLSTGVNELDSLIDQKCMNAPGGITIGPRSSKTVSFTTWLTVAIRDFNRLGKKVPLRPALVVKASYERDTIMRRVFRRRPAIVKREMRREISLERWVAALRGWKDPRGDISKIDF